MLRALARMNIRTSSEDTTLIKQVFHCVQDEKGD